MILGVSDMTQPAGWIGSENIPICMDDLQSCKDKATIHNQKELTSCTSTIFNFVSSWTFAIMIPTKPIQLRDSLKKKNDKSLYNHVQQRSLAYFDEPPKDLQTRTVVSLVCRQHSFVLAGTGYGKSHIVEMYYNLFPKLCKAVVLVLNPLDSLGDNQVQPWFSI